MRGKAETLFAKRAFRLPPHPPPPSENVCLWDLIQVSGRTLFRGPGQQHKASALRLLEMDPVPGVLAACPQLAIEDSDPGARAKREVAAQRRQGGVP